LYPCWLKYFAMALPKPDEAPVIRMRLVMILSLGIGCEIRFLLE